MPVVGQYGTHFITDINRACTMLSLNSLTSDYMGCRDHEIVWSAAESESGIRTNFMEVLENKDEN